MQVPVKFLKVGRRQEIQKASIIFLEKFTFFLLFYLQNSREIF